MSYFHIIQEAVAKAPSWREGFRPHERQGRAAMLIVNGITWTSEVPKTSAEAEAMNRFAERLSQAREIK